MAYERLVDNSGINTSQENGHAGLEVLKGMDAWLFDLDNTLQLGDKFELHARLGAIATHLGMSFTPDEIARFGARSDYREMRKLMVEAHNCAAKNAVTENDFQAVNVAVSGSFDHHFYLADHAEELLSGIKERSIGLAVVTTRGSNSIGRLLQMHGIADYFDVVVNRDICEERKPHPAPIKYALESLGVEEPSRAVFVGDKQEDDVAAGHMAGTATVLVGPAVSKYSERPDFHVASLRPLAELFKPE